MICACGCGQSVQALRRDRPRRFASATCALRSLTRAQRQAAGREGGTASGITKRARRFHDLYELPFLVALQKAFERGQDSVYKLEADKRRKAARRPA